MQKLSQRGADASPESKDKKTGSNRRSFLKKGMAAGAVTVGAGLLTSGSSVFAEQEEKSGQKRKWKNERSQLNT